jgi:hypothetical protein
MIEQSPILVTGIPRSGASIIAGVINLCGAFGGDMSLHPGSYENGAIQQFIETPYLESIGADPMGQHPLPSEINNTPLNWQKLVDTQLLAEGYTKGAWMYKSARAALLWKVWNNAYPNAKWVIVRRRTGDIVQSCLKTGYMAAFISKDNRDAINVNTEEAGWLWWVHEYEKRFVEMITEGVNCKVVWPERMVNGDYRQMYEVLDWIGLPWKTQVLTFVDPLLWGSRNKERRI